MEYIYLILTVAIFLRIAYIDYKEHYIYDMDIGIAAAIILGYNLFLSNIKFACIGGAIGFAIGYAIYVASYYVYKEEAFGFGDVLLLGVFGLFFGYPTFFHYFAITIIATGFIAAMFILYDDKYRKMEVPMAPIFTLGAVSYVLFGFPSVEDVVIAVYYVIFIAIYGLIEIVMSFS